MQAFPGAGHGKRPDKQNNEDDKQRRHTDLIKALNAGFHALDDDEAGNAHKDTREDNCSQWEPCFPGDGIVAQQRIEISQRIGVNLGGLGGVAGHIAQHPAADVAVIGGDDERHRNTRDADPLEAAVAQLAVAIDGIGLRAAADGQFREHDRDANEEYDSKVDEDVRSAAAFVGLAGELPDVSEADGRTGCRQNKADLAAPLGSFRFHSHFLLFYAHCGNCSNHNAIFNG